VPVWHYALRLRIRRRSGVDGRRHARRTTGSFRDACSEAAIPLSASFGCSASRPSCSFRPVFPFPESGHSVSRAQVAIAPKADTFAIPASRRSSPECLGLGRLFSLRWS
jgi:hypothetical protein